MDLAKESRKNEDHLISSCAKEGSTKRQCLPCSLAPAQHGARKSCKLRVLSPQEPQHVEVG